MAISGQLSKRRAANAKALAAFGMTGAVNGANSLYRVVREGRAITVFTIGYERRDGDGLVAALRDAGIDHLADIRDKPISRKPDFRASALRAICEDAGIEYGAWSELGSTEDQRERLRESGDIDAFHRAFRRHALKNMDVPIARLTKVVKAKVVALLCYERTHEECHRSVIADLLADRLNAGITAIM